MRSYRFLTCVLVVLASPTAVLLVGCEQADENRSKDESGLAKIEIESGLAEIEIKVEPTATVALLEAGAQRMSGKVKGKIDKVGEELSGANFTIVPWQKSVNYEITVTKSGYLYFMKGSKEDREKLTLTLEDRPDAVVGPYLPGAYRAKVENGQQITYGGYELSLAAARIVIVESE